MIFSKQIIGFYYQAAAFGNKKAGMVSLAHCQINAKGRKVILFEQARQINKYFLDFNMRDRSIFPFAGFNAIAAAIQTIYI